MVRIVETNRPPIIVAAIPANMASPSNGNIPKIVVTVPSSPERYGF